MKFSTVFVLLAVLLMAIVHSLADNVRPNLALANDALDVQQMDDAMLPGGTLVRHKRLSCSVGVWACVARCNSLGRRNGRCKRGVCHCSG